MPNKLEKWGIEVWCLMDAVAKYAWTWEVYCEKSLEAPNATKKDNKGDPIFGPNMVPLDEEKCVNIFIETWQDSGHVPIRASLRSNVPCARKDAK